MRNVHLIIFSFNLPPEGKEEAWRLQAGSTNGHERRAVQRATWLQDLPENFTYAYAVGSSPRYPEKPDVRYSGLRDSIWFRGAHLLCHLRATLALKDADIVILCEDDTYFNVPELVKYVEQFPLDEAQIAGGPSRVSKQIIALGGGVVLNKKAASLIARTDNPLLPRANRNVMVEVMRICRMCNVAADIDQRFCDHNGYPLPVPGSERISAHLVSPDMMLKIYNNEIEEPCQELQQQESIPAKESSIEIRLT